MVVSGGSGGNHNTTNGNGGGGGGGVIYKILRGRSGRHARDVGVRRLDRLSGRQRQQWRKFSFGALTALGGGGGTTGLGANAFDGGSGGGGAAVNGAFGGGKSIQTDGYGNSGGRSYVGWTGGGGGGAGSAGNAVTIAPNSPPDADGDADWEFQ